MCRVTVAQPMRGIAHIQVGVLQHPAGGMEPHLIQHLGIAGALFRKLALQGAFAGIGQRCRQL